MTACLRPGRVCRRGHLRAAIAAASGPLVVLAAGGAPAEAASGRFCGDPVESGYSTGATQEEALIELVAESLQTQKAHLSRVVSQLERELGARVTELQAASRAQQVR